VAGKGRERGETEIGTEGATGEGSVGACQKEKDTEMRQVLDGQIHLNGIGLRAGWRGGPGPGFRRRRPRAAGSVETAGKE
jgi:hypothetical protein